MILNAAADANPLDGLNRVYPKNCRLHIPCSNSGLIIIEEPPALRTIPTLSAGSRTVRIPLPYVVYLIKYRKLSNSQGGFNYHLNDPYSTRVLFSVKPITDLNAQLIKASFPHVSEGGRVCMGSGDITTRIFNNISDLATASIGAFWSSSFQENGGYTFRNYNANFSVGDHIVNSYSDWSKIEAVDILSAQFAGFKVPLKELVDDMIKIDSAADFGSLVRDPVNKLARKLVSEIVDSKLKDIVERAISEAQSTKIPSEVESTPSEVESTPSETMERKSDVAEAFDELYSAIQKLKNIPSLRNVDEWIFNGIRDGAIRDGLDL